ncbi:hypothetical protein [Flavicella sediminum]|uniref:hypothetical protein n=1 Tax=Flavicella sediminum TaxID=2585141 RepID=UPI0011239992|nr:hypothetical protein [Flavicella sediminum]
MKKFIFSTVILFSIVSCKVNKNNSEKSVATIIDTNQKEVGLDNGVLSLKLDLTRGGAIFYISESGKERNIVNVHDEGRYIQQSYYAGKSINRTKDGQNPDWSPWSWNPIQVGDSYKNRAEIVACTKTENTLYVKCIPMLWDMNNEPAEATIEQWSTLEGNVIKVHNRLTCFRKDSIYDTQRDKKANAVKSESEKGLYDIYTEDGGAPSQELPAVYPISALKNLYSYFGKAPFTGDTLDNPVVEHLEDGFWGRYKNQKVSEHWMAFVDDNKWGLGVYTPIASNFLAGMAGAPGFESTDSQTSYIAPIKAVALKKNDVFEYDYWLIVGDLDDIRSKVYKLNETLK